MERHPHRPEQYGRFCRPRVEKRPVVIHKLQPDTLFYPVADIKNEVAVYVDALDTNPLLSDIPEKDLFRTQCLLGNLTRTFTNSPT